MTTVKQVVIVGGSFSGLAVASELSSYPDKFAVTLIDARSAWEFTPSLHESIGGGREAESNLTTIDVKLFAGKKGDAHKVVLGRAVSLDGRAVVVQPRGGAAVRVDFDVLVVACGCAYAPPVRTAAEDSDRPERLREIQGWSEGLGSAASILIVGGGAVGVELAGEVASRAAPPGGRRIVLATAASSLVVDLPVASRERAHKALAAMGVEVRFNCRAAPVGVAGAFGAGSYALTSGGATEELEAEAAMFCFGGAPNTAWLKGSAVDLDAAGFVCRDACLQATGAEDVYVVGDCALKPDAQRLASFAHFEGEYLAAVLAARHSAAAAGASRPVSAPYTPPPRFVALSLGPRDGIFVYDSVAIPIPGFLVPYIKAAIKGWFVRLMPMPYAILSLLPGDKSARLWTKPARAPRAPAAVAAH
eukprot:CAMPEP_0206815348 /NCGR_PEP_ID=MMETSP0975-20121206/9243_1 /ASSEMBLY_ACC=CAM_ASM_000399 /TAXON_ID=483370 /ORGANISM="non described non described, Strain CCMP2097" /LENGTH=417 /DNA_ID=CAMNT_0054357531 /DNA_START=51 /DNA_END=1305 /DNA_ORIENTATION=-